MSKLLISKRGTAPVSAIVAGIFMLLLCVMFFALGLTEPDFRDSDFDRFTKILAPVLLAIAGIIMIGSSLMMGKSYINVYDDHVEGEGMKGSSGLNLQSFYFNKSADYMIQKKRNGIAVTCGGTSFLVPMKAFDADQICRAASGGYRGSYAGASAAPKREYASKQEPAPKREPVRKPPKQEDIPVAEYAAYEPEEEYTNAFCTECGTKCRVPKGKGSIRITCPSCGNKFPFNT